MKASHVVIQTAFLGDLILTVPFLNALKKRFPDDRIIVICKKGLGSFLLEEQIVDQFYEIDKGDRLSYQKVLVQLKEVEIENLFCIHRSIRSQLFSYQIKAGQKLGFTSFLGRFIFDQYFKYEETWPDVIRKFKLLTPFDKTIEAELFNNNWSDLNQADEEGRLPKVPDLFSFHKSGQLKSTLRKKNKISIFPGSVWPTKKWTEEGFILVVKHFLRLGFQVDLMGGADEKQICLNIANATGANVLAGSLSIAKSILQLSEYDLVIANDSAATHMAVLKKIPVVTIFGPTTLDLGFRPWSNNSRVVQIRNLACRPCGKHGHFECPLGHHNCMKKITSEQVVDVALKLLKESYSNY